MNGARLRRPGWWVVLVGVVAGGLIVTLVIVRRDPPPEGSRPHGWLVMARGGPGEQQLGSSDSFVPRRLRLVEVSTADGTVRDLTNGDTLDTGPEVSPDGTLVAFSRADPSSPSPVFRIHILDLESGRVRPLVPCAGEGCDSQGSPAWNPDGTELVVVNSKGLAIVELATGDVRQLRLPLGLIGVTDPTWAPDGEALAFSAQTSAAPGAQIWVLDVEPHRFETITECPTDECAAHLAPAWSPDGDAIAFIFVREPGEAGEITLVSPDGTGLRRVATCDAAVCNGEMAPTWSSDGRALAFVREEDLFLHDLEEQITRRITGGEQVDCCPSWIL